MTNYKRHGFKWGVNETLKLQREYELLNLPIEEIAAIHQRSVHAIECKVEQEEFERSLGEDESIIDQHHRKELVSDKLLREQIYEKNKELDELVKQFRKKYPSLRI
jgi:hypothetical protein